MSYYDDTEEIECRIIESYGIFSFGGKSWNGAKSWNKEVNYISWNGRPAKLDIRNWQSDHEKCGKGIAITWEEAEELVKLLNKILKAGPRAGTSDKSQTSKETGTAKKRTKRTTQAPRTLEQFYKELKLSFGAGPEECKSARNALLKKYHPDLNTGNIAFATRKTIKIKEAYEKIMAWWEAAKL